ncbi:TPA: hypothetical protein ACXE8V_000588 [Pluralibacter gergoviae]
MSWLLLEEHHNFVSAWQLIYDIAQVSDVKLSRAAHLLARLNEVDPMDGGYAIPFYGHRKFDGYFLASETEIELCIGALKKVVLFESVSVFDGERMHDISLEDGFSAKKGMDFFFKKQDVIKAIEYKSMEMGAEIPLPSCVIDTPKKPFTPSKPARKTENAKSRFIKNLLIVMYGENVAENPRSHIDGKCGQIKKDMDTKGLACPTGVTLEKWISEID